jgi:hypothetical protein
MPYKEYYIYSIDNQELAGGNGTVFTDTDLRLDTDADFECIKRIHVATDDQILVAFKDDSFGRNLQNQPLDLRTISGTSIASITPNGFLPFVLPRPYLFRAATTITAALSDFSTSANAIRLSLHGAKIRNGQAPWAESWRATPAFDYTGSVTLAANGTASMNISINIDAHFVVRKITAIRAGAALITIKDGATDRQWMDRPIHIDNLAGNSQFPNILPAPRFIYKGSVINITLQDLSASSNFIRLNFHGEKLF